MVKGESHIEAQYEMEETDGFYVISIFNNDTIPIDYILVLNSYYVDFLLPGQSFL